MWFWEKLMWLKPKPQPEFWDRMDEASEIVAWDERMDAYIALMQEDVDEYIAWARAKTGWK